MSILSFFGHWAGRTASEWIRMAQDFAAHGGNYSNIRDCCYNAARAALGNVPWDQIVNYAENLLRSIIR